MAQGTSMRCDVQQRLLFHGIKCNQDTDDRDPANDQCWCHLHWITFPDFQYFAPYLEPKVIDNCSIDLDATFLDPPKIGGLDPSHHVRTARHDGNDDKTEIVFSTERGIGGEEAYISFNFKYIKQLARDRRFRNKYNLHEISTFDDVIDQKGDASWHLFSWKMIDLLQRHAPRDIKAQSWK